MTAWYRFLLKDTYQLDPNFGLSTAHTLTIICGTVILIATIILIVALRALTRNKDKSLAFSEERDIYIIMFGFVITIMGILLANITFISQTKTYHLKSGYVQEIKIEELSSKTPEYVYKAYKYNVDDNGYANAKLTSKHISKHRVTPTDDIFTNK